MNFLERIKEELNGPRNRQGTRDKVVVDARSLRELLDHFETMDTAERALHLEGRALEIEHQLHNLIVAAYHQQGKDAETTLMLIMGTLQPLMESRRKEREAIYRFGS